MSSTIDSTIKHWGKITALIGSITAVATFIASLFGWSYEIVLSVVSLSSLIIVSSAVMVDKAVVQRKKYDSIQDQRISDITKEFEDKLSKIERLAHESLCSSIRNEMNSLMRYSPENHEMIIMYAERYFNVLGANWSETTIFMNWVESENAAGRPISIPPQLFHNIEKASHTETSK